MKKCKRVFVGPHEVAGYYYNLHIAFHKIGIKSDYIVYHYHENNYTKHQDGSLIVRIICFFNKYRQKDKTIRAIQLMLALFIEALGFIHLLVIINKYDAFIFGFSHSLMPITNLDLLLLNKFNKRIISVVGHGSEARPVFIDGSYKTLDGRQTLTPKQIFRANKRRKNKLRFISKHSSLLVGSHFNSSFYIAQKMINGLALGLPYNPEKHIENYKISPVINKKSKVRILHAPSHPSFKGTSKIKRALQELSAEGLDFEFVLIQGKSHAEVVEEIKKCDLVIDQIYSDTPLAGLAVEAAWQGKPSLIGGYGLDYLKSLMPNQFWPVSVLCKPNEIKLPLAKLISDKAYRERVGKQAYEFVSNNWSSESVASKYKLLLKDDIPKEWWFDPKEVVYIAGAGQSIEETTSILSALISELGIGSLCLQDRPDLSDRFDEILVHQQNN